MRRLRLSAIILLSLFFWIVNIFIIWLLSLFSGNLILEMYKWLQFISVILFVLYLFKNKIVAFLIISFIYFSYLVLITYYTLVHTKLDFSFLSRNFGDINPILSQFTFHLLLIGILALTTSLIICKFRPNLKNKYFYIFPILVILLPGVIHHEKLNNELIYFIQTIFRKDKIIDHYQNVYSQLVQDSIRHKNKIIQQAKKIDKEALPKHVGNIIILQLESLNGFLVNEKNTPNFMAMAKEGILFPKIYSNSIQTILAQENILCSLPSSFDMNLVASGTDKKILGLPEILKEMGFKTFFLKSYRLSFAKTGEFMNNLLFDEVHSDDIMSSNDAQYPWGYREDIFFERAFDYFQKNKKEIYNFLYIEIGPTSHWPFVTPSGLEDEVPYKNPSDFKERLINTTFLQDQYLKIAWDRINDIFPDRNYTLIVVSDHSWPAGFHKDNIFNEKGAYEENFVTSMVAIIGDKYKGKIINTRYSHMDIMPSILELLGISFNNKFSRSFIKELNGEKVLKKKILLIQPYADRYINVIDYPLKYQYNSDKGNIILYNLEKDANEENGQIIGHSKEKNLQLIERLLG